ncbi:fumarylacetoacetate hydrolase family protein [Corynebacterium heidelbergense]|uniref:FAA hydrolase family protein n=1 Tax=Corynebacterium heidelbergense TaxID=2055947 RepID=A0A364VEB4_9CORY|nr:fumarylacetoacetate hydrolase family protein [Corynebacterium heidelbergense]RAV34983.1 FAA hydrolase family protein [Corynebacterium heidelbergense]WCZ35917.1 Ureidoglycolate lyase [Corynebacterium heidelbergense]
MRLATVDIAGQHTVVDVVEFEDGRGRGRVLADGCVGQLLGRGDLSSVLGDATAAQHGAAATPRGMVEFTSAQLLPVVPRPGKIFCVGLNYREHIQEMGHEIPEHPTLFAKYASALAAPFAQVNLPAALGQQADYEGELAVVVGAGGRVAGYAVMNDFSQRDWQYRTQQWLQGKNADASSAFGPWLTPAQEVDPVADGATLRTWVNGELRQEHSVSDLVFPPAELVEYISQFARLEPGDVIVTGTPEGVGHGMKPPRYLADGDEVRISIEGLGEVSSTVRMG